MLSKNGYHVDTAEGGDDAVKAAQNVSYDLILMDGCMPNKTSLEAAEEIRADEAAKGLEMEDRSPFFILLFSKSLEMSGKVFMQRQIWLFMSFRCTIIGLTGTSSKEYDTKCLEAGMSDILLKPITRKLLLEKVEFWTQNKATARKTKQRLLQTKATDKQPKCSNSSPAAYSSKAASMPPQKFKAVVFGKVVFGVCSCHSFLCFVRGSAVF
jgi:CheY-like chemotaxis protein